MDLPEVDMAEALEGGRGAMLPLPRGERFPVPAPGGVIGRYMERNRPGYRGEEIRDSFHFGALVEHARHEQGGDFNVAP